jgi:hypothetical protein
MTRLLKDILYETICGGGDRIEVALPDFIQYNCRYYLVLVKLVLGLFPTAQGLSKNAEVGLVALTRHATPKAAGMPFPSESSPNVHSLTPT